jgi:hypothetical protein
LAQGGVPLDWNESAAAAAPPQGHVADKVGRRWAEGGEKVGRVWEEGG